MKPIFSKIRVLGTAALALFLTASCSDILDEQPRSSYDPTFFKTEKGVEGGVTSMYCLLYTSPSPRDRQKSRMPSSA